MRFVSDATVDGTGHVDRASTGAVDATLTVGGVTVRVRWTQATPLATATIGDQRAGAGRPVMDAFLAIVSRREVRDYDGRPLPEDAVRRILEAGRLAGSSRNRQQRRFVVLSDREAVAAAVFNPGNVRGAALLVAIVVSGKGPLALDAGRAAQNMLLAAHNEGIGSCPNGIADAEAMARGRRRRRRASRSRPCSRSAIRRGRATRSGARRTSGSRARTASRSTRSSQSADAISFATWPAAASGTAAKLISSVEPVAAVAGGAVEHEPALAAGGDQRGLVGARDVDGDVQAGGGAGDRRVRQRAASAAISASRRRR